MPSIAAVSNFYNESSALPGWLECVTAWADHVTLYHTGPGGEYSTDGSIEIAERWGVDLRFGSIDEGFGVVRTKLITMAPTEWVAILDADERLYPNAPDIYLDNGAVRKRGTYDQIGMLRDIIKDPAIDAVVTSRRHWSNFHWDAPTQSWEEIPDWQARIVRNCDWVVYKSEVRMHEQILDLRTGHCPNWYHPQVPGHRKIYFDHYHCHFKPMEAHQRAHDVAIYDCLDAGTKPPTLEEFRKK